MDAKSKTTFTQLVNEDSYFYNVIKKMTIWESLSDN